MGFFDIIITHHSPGPLPALARQGKEMTNTMEKIGSVPEFTDADTQAGAESAPQVQEEVPAGEETPSEAATENEPNGETTETEKPIDNASAQNEIQNELAGLRQAREELIRELKELRGERREYKQREIDRVDAQIQETTDDLEDVNPDDTKLIERVLKARGYVPQSEVNKMFFEAKKQEVVAKFLRDFPEYKPDNDPENKRWESLKKELSLYREPSTAEDYETLLKRAHRMVSAVSTSGQNVAVKKHQAQVASAGSGGTRKPSSQNRLASLAEQHLKGFTQEEIAEMQKRLSNR